MSIKFGAAAHQQLEPETAARLLEALFTEAPGVFGYFLAVAVTGAPPSRPRSARSAHTAPDQQQPGQLRPVPSAAQK
jgi:hypothetical protein